MPRPPASGGRRLDCGCGFAVEGEEDEVVVAARHHARHVHGISLTDGMVRAMARAIPESTGAARTDSHTEGSGDQP